MVVCLVLVDSGTVVLVGLPVVLFCDSVVGTVKEALTVKNVYTCIYLTNF